MFPKKASDAYIQNNGQRSTLGSMMSGGGGSDLPEYDSSDAGKVLSVDSDGELEWSQPSAPLTMERFSSSNLTMTFAYDGFIILLNHGDTTQANVTITIPDENTYTFKINDTTNNNRVFPVKTGSTIEITNDSAARNSVYYYH